MIDIGTVLNNTNQTVQNGKGNVFSLKYVKKDGAIREFKRAMRWTKDFNQSQEMRSAMDTARKSTVNYNDKDLILIHDLDSPATPKRSISIHTIVEFNGQRVNH